MIQILNVLSEEGLYIAFCILAFLPKSRKRMILFQLFPMLLFGAAAIYFLVDSPLINGWILLVPFVYIRIVSGEIQSKKWFQLFLSVILSAAAFNICYILMFLTADIHFHEYIADGIYKIPFILFAYIVIICTLSFWGVEEKESSRNRAVTLLAAVNTMTAIIMEVMSFQYTIGKIGKGASITVSVFALLISPTAFVLYRMVEKNMNYVQEAEARQVMILEKSDQAKIAEIKKHYDVLRGIRHDLKHHVDVVSELYARGKAEEGDEFIRQLRNSIVRTFHSGNESFDALLFSKITGLEKAEIVFNYEISDLTELPIGEVALCSIVGNLLDNAMESLIRQKSEIQDRYIELEVRRTRNLLQIKCVNPVCEKLIKKEGEVFVTSKEGSSHGLGIANIRSIVAENSGSVFFNIDNGLFIADIWLSYSAGK